MERSLQINFYCNSLTYGPVSPVQFERVVLLFHPHQSIFLLHVSSQTCPLCKTLEKDMCACARSVWKMPSYILGMWIGRLASSRVFSKFLSEMWHPIKLHMCLNVFYINKSHCPLVCFLVVAILLCLVVSVPLVSIKEHETTGTCTHTGLLVEDRGRRWSTSV